MNKETGTYLEQFQIEEQHKQWKKLLLQPTRVQLGHKIEIAGIEAFKVEYELPDGVTIEQIENARKETGLTILFITLVNSLTVNTEDVDGVSDGYGGYTFTEVVTGVELDAEYLYTYY